jgi:hypothetical protein
LPRAAAWFAVATTDQPALVAALGLRTVLPANWADGLAEAKARGVFVTPCLAGWTLVVGSDVAALDPNGDVVPWLERLSRRFGRAAWFHRDDDGENHGWALAIGGEVQRAYAYDGEHGHVAWAGEVTADEHALGCFVDDARDRSDDDVKWWPDARLVDALAARWSLDVQRLDGHAAASGCGSVGRL